MFLLGLLTVEREMLKTPNVIVGLSISTCSSVRFYFDYFQGLSLGAMCSWYELTLLSFCNVLLYPW